MTFCGVKMRIRCRLILEYDDEKTARIVYDSVRIDDGRFVDTRLDKNKVIAGMTSVSPASLLHTLNDYLACVSVAEKVMDND